MDTPILMGYYRHYKGGVYQVLAFAKHSETLEDLVIYRHSDGALWARPLSMWSERVQTPTGSVLRFTLLSKEGDPTTPSS